MFMLKLALRLSVEYARFLFVTPPRELLWEGCRAFLYCGNDIDPFTCIHFFLLVFRWTKTITALVLYRCEKRTSTNC